MAWGTKIWGRLQRTIKLILPPLETPLGEEAPTAFAGSTRNSLQASSVVEKQRRALWACYLFAGRTVSPCIPSLRPAVHIRQLPRRRQKESSSVRISAQTTKQKRTLTVSIMSEFSKENLQRFHIQLQPHSRAREQVVATADFI